MRLILFRRSLVIGNTPLIAMAIKHQLFCPEFQRTLSVIQISCRKISKHQTTRNSLYLRNKGDALMQLAKYSELFTLLHHLYLRLKPIIRSGLKPMKSLRGVNFYSPLLTCGFAEKLPYFAPLGFNWFLWRVSANWDRRPGQFTPSTNLLLPVRGVPPCPSCTAIRSKPS